MTDERDPLAGRSGLLVEMIRSLDDAGVDQHIRYWESRHDELAAAGDGYGAWWCSKLMSAGLAERRRRTGT